MKLVKLQDNKGNAFYINANDIISIEPKGEYVCEIWTHHHGVITYTTMDEPVEVWVKRVFEPHEHMPFDTVGELLALVKADDEARAARDDGEPDDANHLHIIDDNLCSKVVVIDNANMNVISDIVLMCGGLIAKTIDIKSGFRHLTICIVIWNRADKDNADVFMSETSKSIAPCFVHNLNCP